MNFEITPNHPRYQSILTRHQITEGYEKGITALAGVIAQGRGEAFDYLIGEKTTPSAVKAIEAAAALLLLARCPILSVNGNSVVLSAKETVLLSKIANAPMEVNLFYRTTRREKAIKKALIKAGGDKKAILGVGLGKKAVKIEGLEHARGIVDPQGIAKADVVFIPLEDGDRTRALKKMGKKVISIDLNPFSRTAQESDITIIDNITRAMPLLIEKVKKFQTRALSEKELQSILKDYHPHKSIQEALKEIQAHLQKSSKERGLP